MNTSLPFWALEVVTRKQTLEDGCLHNWLLTGKHRMWADSPQVTTPNQATVGQLPVSPAELRTMVQTVPHTVWCLAPEEGSFLVLDNMDSPGTAWQAVLQAGFCSRGCFGCTLPSPQLTQGAFPNLTEPQFGLPNRGGNNICVSVTTVKLYMQNISTQVLRAQRLGVVNGNEHIGNKAHSSHFSVYDRNSNVKCIL